MKTINTIKYLIIMLFLLSSSYAIAEESGDIYIDALFGYGQSIHQNIKYQNEISREDRYCPQGIEMANSKDYYLGIRLEYIFLAKNYFSNSFAFSSDYEYSSLIHHYPGDGFPSIVSDPHSPSNRTVVFTSTEYEEEMEINSINFDLLYSFKFKSVVKFGVSLGPFFSIPFNTFSSEEYKILKPKDVTFNEVPDFKFRDSNRTVVIYEGKIKNLNPFYWGLKTNAFLKYEFFDLIKTTLEAGYTYPFSCVTSDSDWKIESYYTNLIISIKLKDII